MIENKNIKQILDVTYGKDDDSRWHSCFSDYDFETFPCKSDISNDGISIEIENNFEVIDLVN